MRLGREAGEGYSQKRAVTKEPWRCHRCIWVEECRRGECVAFISLEALERWEVSESEVP